MDVLTGLLNSPRANRAFLLKSVLDPPWSLRIQDEAPLTVITIMTGVAWLVTDGSEPVQLRPGGVAIVRGPGHYTVADNPLRPTTVIIHPGQLSTTIEGEELCEAMDLGLRTWGNTSAGSVTMVTGTYQTPTEISRLLLDALPAVIVVPESAWDSPFLELLGSEMTKDQPGQEVVLDRLLDLVVIAALRVWLGQSESETPERLGAHHDPVVRTALKLVQSDPARAWTVASLATETGVSRAAFARRFTSVMGVPPMAYLTEWRLALAADLLREPTTTIGSVAREVGYGSAFALSTAFKRIRGVSPHHYRLGRAVS
jgi:AraC-like DNA-binding protein